MLRFDESRRSLIQTWWLPISVKRKCPFPVFETSSSNLPLSRSDYTMSKQKALVSFLRENQGYDFGKDDLFVNITLYRIPASLVQEFGPRIAANYPGGISEAIQDLMKNALKYTKDSGV